MHREIERKEEGQTETICKTNLRYKISDI